MKIWIKSTFRLGSHQLLTLILLERLITTVIQTISCQKSKLMIWAQSHTARIPTPALNTIKVIKGGMIWMICCLKTYNLGFKEMNFLWLSYPLLFFSSWLQQSFWLSIVSKRENTKDNKCSKSTVKGTSYTKEVMIFKMKEISKTADQ